VTSETKIKRNQPTALAKILSMILLKNEKQVPFISDAGLFSSAYACLLAQVSLIDKVAK
jgi:hypothetical protein